MQKLSEAQSGIKLRLISVDAPQDPHVMRLCELGFVPGSSMQILRNSNSSTPLLIEINGALLCVERRLAQLFWVQGEGNL